MKYEPITYYLDGGVVPKARPRATGARRRGGGQKVVLPENYRIWKGQAGRSFLEQSMGVPGRFPIEQTSTVKVKFTGKHSRKGDGDNTVGAILDAMQAIDSTLINKQVLKNDNLLAIPSSSFRLIYSENQEPKTEVMIYPKPDTDWALDKFGLSDTQVNKLRKLLKQALCERYYEIDLFIYYWVMLALNRLLEQQTSPGASNNDTCSTGEITGVCLFGVRYPAYWLERYAEGVCSGDSGIYAAMSNEFLDDILNPPSKLMSIKDFFMVAVKRLMMVQYIEVKSIVKHCLKKVSTTKRSKKK